jgi:hypothetical protein
MKKHSKKAALAILLVLAALPMSAQDNGQTLNIGGLVPLQLTLTLIPDDRAQDLPLVGTTVDNDQIIAGITIATNSTAGWELWVYSVNGSELLNNDGDSIAYTITYTGTGTLATAAIPIGSAANGTGLLVGTATDTDAPNNTADTGDLTITYTQTQTGPGRGSLPNGRRNEFFQSSASHLLAFIPEGGETRNTSSLRGRSGIVYADRIVAVTRPITDSFIIIAPAEHVADRTFRLGQSVPGRPRVIRGQPELLGGARSHVPREITLEMDEFDPSIDTDALAWVVKPTYRSGTVIRIDPPRRIQVRGILADRAGRPLPLVVGYIEGGSSFFTDEAGYFEIYDLLPGDYVVRVEGRSTWVYDLRVDGSVEQIQDVETILPREEGL